MHKKNGKTFKIRLSHFFMSSYAGSSFRNKEGKGVRALNICYIEDNSSK
jgi:hypothetical protein